MNRPDGLFQEASAMNRMDPGRRGAATSTAVVPGGGL
jgi:hypothetical protein